MKTAKNSSTSMVLRLLAVAVGMFGFGFALVPLYSVFCEITGLNGKTGDQYSQAETQTVDSDRLVTIQFLTSNNSEMPWDFRPKMRTLQVHPGALNETSFFARNPANYDMTAQAVPSVTPFMAARYLHKTECFCFEQQALAAGESIDMPLRFIIDKDLPAEIETLTLSYTMFDITEPKPSAD
ncbi:MAG: cytochrome c oxidase assembly protein subunit 11 [Candidatus Azotimanducaceae bacterium]|jgi:cytochrome c oxidase assembly protein subunit 11